MTEHISINEAIKTGVTKLRLDNWADPADHIEIYIADQIKGWTGPWVKFWSPTLEHTGQKNPQELLITTVGDPDDKCWTPYRGPDSTHSSRQRNSDDMGMPSPINPARVLREDGT